MDNRLNKEEMNFDKSDKNLRDESIIENQDFKFEEDNFNAIFFASLNEFRSDEVFCDISIKIENKTIKAHKIVLASSIPYFKAMFESNMVENTTNEVEIKENITFTTFEKIINYAYSGEITLPKEDVPQLQQILIASSFLCIKSILNASLSFIIKNLNHSNVLEYKAFSNQFTFPILEKEIENYINEEFLHIYKTKGFLDLTYEEILAIISSSELNIDEEKTVFEAVICWIRADEKNRKDYLCALLEQIRLPFISSEYIVDNIISEDLIKKCLRCRDLIDEAKDWHLLPQRRNLIQNHRTTKRSFTRKEHPIMTIGSTTDAKTYFEIYDTIKDEWNMYLIENRQLKLRTSISVLKNKLISIGGYSDGIRTNNVEVFNLIENKWSQIASLNEKRSALSSVALDGKIYIMGGYNGTVTLSSAECFSPNLNKWIYISDMNRRRCSSASVVCQNCIYVIGGHDGSTIFKSMERYDPIVDKWVLCKDMTKERCRLGATSLNGLIYCGGGFTGDNQLEENSFEVYNPKKDEWSKLAPMNKARSRFNLIASGHNRIYAIGGYVRNNFTSTCEVYDVEKDSWSFVKSMCAKVNPTSSILLQNLIKKE